MMFLQAQLVDKEQVILLTVFCYLHPFPAELFTYRLSTVSCFSS
jgi:hypothetical protein